MSEKRFLYDLMALATITVWGVTFVSAKVLIACGLSPVEIFIMRFTIAYFCTLVFSHDRLWALSSKDEFFMIMAGATGGSLYFIAENTALGITFASNVSLIICCAPIFTMVLGKVFLKDKINLCGWIGSITAFLGVAIVVFNGAKQYGINPAGDLLTILAALSWATYCLLLKRLSFRYSNLFITRKVFAYGVFTAIIYYSLFSVRNHSCIIDFKLVFANIFFLVSVRHFCVILCGMPPSGIWERRGHQTISILYHS